MDKNSLLRCNVSVLFNIANSVIEDNAVMLFLGEADDINKFNLNNKFSKIYAIHVDINSINKNTLALLLLIAFNTFKDHKQLVVSSYNEVASVSVVTSISNMFGVETPSATAFESLPTSFIELSCDTALDINLWEKLNEI